MRGKTCIGTMFLLLGFALTAVAGPEPVVVTPPDPPAAVRIAAEEFQKYWELITGRRIVIAAHLPAKAPTVKIGFPSDDPLFSGETDAYAVKSVEDGLEITGKNPRSVLYGTYEFFRQKCGCRWFWDGDVVPKAERIDLSGVDIREKSQFLYRGCQYFSHRGLVRFHAETWGWADWRKELDWCVKNRLNLFMLHFGKEDLFQLAYPDIVPYPDPAVTEPCDAMGELLHQGYNQRTSFWSMEYRNLLRHCILDYARARGMIHPEKIGPATHWFYRTPPEFLKAKKPDFTPQVGGGYGEPSGLVWDVRQPKWREEYWKLTEAAVKEYGEPGMFFNMGFDERTVYASRADNMALKIDIMKRFNDESHRRRPDAPVVMEGWDFFLTWQPHEVKQLLKALDPSFAIVWDFTADDAVGFARRPGIPLHNVFTGWGVTNAFPYSFGVTLAHNRGMDIRGQYDAIREREKAIVGDPMCKAYIIWPETSHSDIFAWRYFTENCWRLSGKATGDLLSDFCRDRYGKQAEAFETAWKKVIPMSQLWHWARCCSDIIGWDAPRRLNDAKRWLKTKTPEAISDAPDVFAALAKVDWNGGDFVRRDALDIARTAFDRSVWFAYEELLNAYHRAAIGQATAADVKAKADRCVALVRLFAETLELHSDFSLSESMDRIMAVEKVRNPDFEHVFFENSACQYCLSHQAEYAKGWYVPSTEELAELLVTRAKAKDFSPLPSFTDYRAKLRALTHPIRAFAPDPSRRTAENFRRLMREAFAATDHSAAAETEGWTDIGSTRMIVPPADELWTAPASIADFKVEKRDGAEGTVDIVGQTLRISKTNEKGMLLVIARRPFAAAAGRKLRASVEVSVPMAVPERSQGFVRMFGRRENLDFHSLDGLAFMRGGVRMTNLYCTAEGVWERKFAHYEASPMDGTNVTCALAVAGAPSISLWRGWCVEDADAAQGRWREYMAAHPPTDFAADRISRDEFRARLDADSEHSAAVRSVGGVPRLFVDGVETPPVIYKGKLPRPWETNIFTFAGRRLEREGVRLQTATIRFGRTAGRAGFWTRDGFDAEGAAEYLEEAMRAAPESLFIPTFHLDAYPEFSAEHPGEVWRRADGSPVFGNGGQAEKVTAHDPALEGRWPWMSYHSTAWREAVKTNLTALVAAFRRRGLTKRIVGVHIAGYHDGQFATQVADFSPCALKAFAEATGRPAVAPRFGTDEWLVPGRDDAAIAYLAFLKDQPLHLQEDFVRHLRRLFDKPVVSAIWCMSAYSGTMGHAYFTTAFLDSPEIDMLVSQQEYGYRAPGVPLGTKLPFASFRRHCKLYINEFDYRTWGAFEMWTDSEMSSIGLGRVLDRPAWETVHRRAAGQMFAERAGFWYYDMGGGWFAPPEIARDIGDVRRAESSLHTAHPSTWRPSAAFVIDEKGLLLANQPYGLYEERQRALIRRQIQQLASSSVPYDTWLMEDLLRDPELGMSYSVVVFAGMHAVDGRRRALLSKLEGDGRALVFLAGTGAADGAKTKGVAVPKRDGLTADAFHNVVWNAGGYVPVNRPGLQICMNGDFVCVHCLVPGAYDFRLPVDGDWENMKTGHIHRAVEELPLDLIAGETRWYRRTALGTKQRELPRRH